MRILYHNSHGPITTLCALPLGRRASRPSRSVHPLGQRASRPLRASPAWAGRLVLPPNCVHVPTSLQHFAKCCTPVKLYRGQTTVRQLILLPFHYPLVYPTITPFSIPHQTIGTAPTTTFNASTINRTSASVFSLSNEIRIVPLATSSGNPIAFSTCETRVFFESQAALQSR